MIDSSSLYDCSDMILTNLKLEIFYLSGFIILDFVVRDCDLNF